MLNVQFNVSAKVIKHSLGVFQKLVLISALLWCPAMAAYSGPDFTQYVNPFHNPSNSNSFHGANIPHSTIMVDPFDENGHFAYALFTLSGASMGDVHSQAYFVPTITNQGTLTQNLSVAGYHHVKYSGLETEIATTLRTAHCRFTVGPLGALTLSIFAKAVQNNSAGGIVSQPDQYTVRCSTSINQHPICLIYKFKQPVTLSGSSVQITQSGATPIEMKISESLYDFAHAQGSITVENPGWNFDSVRVAARDSWNTALSRLAVEGTDAVKGDFYTQLFRVLAHENVLSENDGMYKYTTQGPYETDIWNSATAQGYTHYANISGWDIWRTWNQLMGFVYTDRANDMARSLVVDGVHNGRMPQWTVWTQETGVMSNCGLAGPNMLANFYAFGAQDFSNKADGLRIMLRDTTEYLNRFASTSNYEGASNVVESGASLFCIAQYAAQIGDTLTYRRAMKMAAGWKNRYSSNGTLTGGGGCEDPVNIYEWMIPWNMMDLLALKGSLAEASMDAAQKGSNEYICNEPEFHLPFTYNWIGKPWKTQKAVHDALVNGYYPGQWCDDDLGAMSSWAVWTMMGIYPAIYAIPGFTIHAPAITKATIAFGKGAGRKLTIIGQNASDVNYYVQSVTLNGAAWTSTWLPISALDRDSNTLIINCGSQPSLWGSRPQDAPPSFNENSIPTSIPVYAPLKRSLPSACMVKVTRSLDISIAGNGFHKILISTTNGVIVKSFSGSGSQEYHVNRALLPSACYIMQAHTSEGTIVQKISIPQ